MAATRQIRVDPDVYEALRAKASTWEDTPNVVLRRLLGLNGNGGPSTEDQESARSATA